LALAFALTSVGAFAVPADALVVHTSCQGLCGTSIEYDAPNQVGARCDNGPDLPYALRQIEVRPPKMYGHYSSKTKVGWRFQIYRVVGTNTVQLVYTSRWQTAMASKTVAVRAGHGFTWRTWKPSNPQTYYRAWITERWWHNGSVEGTRQVEYENYKSSFGDPVQSSVGSYCYAVIS